MILYNNQLYSPSFENLAYLFIIYHIKISCLDTPINDDDKISAFKINYLSELLYLKM